MGAADLPPVLEHSTKAYEVRQLDARVGAQNAMQEEIEKHRTETREPSAKGDSSEKMGDKPEVHIRDHGQIKDMTLPKDWVEGGPYKINGPGTRSFREVHPTENPDVLIGFFYRGLKISEDGGKNFHGILDKPPHSLSPDELTSLSDVLRDKGNHQDFTMYSAKTMDWNGKKVLVVEGRYKELQQDALEIFIDANNDGRVVQEVYYQAPKDSFLKYLKAAKDSLRSIQWE